MQQLSTVLVAVLLRLAELTRNQLIPHAQRWRAVQKGWGESSSHASEIIPWVMGVLVVSAFVFAIVFTRRERAKQKEREFVYYQRKAAEKGLDPQCLKLMEQAVRTMGLQQPFRVLDSFDIFQHLIEQYERKSDFSEQEHAYFIQMVEKIKDTLGFRQIEEAVPLTTSREIKAGQTVKVKLGRDGQEFEYDSCVLDNEEKVITLDGSGMDFGFLRLGFDTTLEVIFHREADAGYNFLTTITKAPDPARKHLFIKHPKKLERTQARNFSRMEVVFPFSYYHIEKNRFNTIEIDTNLIGCESRPVYRGESVDISGGGIAFNTYRKVSRGDFLYLNFQMLSEEHTEPLLAEVVWSGKDKKNENLQLVRARFFSITDKMQDALMKFVYQMQRRVARRMKFAPKR
ncbi:PilZ domain-containing protein [bacterium]|nr:PilZ domain-containing protein [bacterium]